MTSLRQRMASGATISFVSLIIAKAVLVVNSVVIARQLGGTNLGLYTIVLNLSSMASLAATLGVPSAVVKFLSGRNGASPDRVSEYVTAGFVLTLASAGVTVAGLALAAPLLASSIYSEQALVPLIWIASLGLLLGAVPSALFAAFQGFQRIRDLGVRRILTAVASVPITVSLVVLGGLTGAVVAVIAVEAASIFISWGFWRRVRRERQVRWTFGTARRAYRAILGYAFPGLLSSVVMVAALWGANTILATRESFRDLGLFAVANSLANYLVFIPAAVNVPLIPIASELYDTNRGDFQRIVVKTMRMVLFLALPLAATLILFSGPIVSLLYGPEFAPAAGLLVLMAAAMLLQGFNNVTGAAIAGTGKMWDAFVLNIAWAFVFLAGSATLVDRFGSWGLASAFVASYVFHTGTSLTYGRLRFGLDCRRLLVPIALVAATVIASVAVVTWMPPPLSWVASAALLGALTLAEWRIADAGERGLLLETADRFLSRPGA